MKFVKICESDRKEINLLAEFTFISCMISLKFSMMFLTSSFFFLLIALSMFSLLAACAAPVAVTLELIFSPKAEIKFQINCSTRRIKSREFFQGRFQSITMPIPGKNNAEEISSHAMIPGFGSWRQSKNCKLENWLFFSISMLLPRLRYHTWYHGYGLMDSQGYRIQQPLPQ